MYGNSTAYGLRVLCESVTRRGWNAEILNMTQSPDATKKLEERVAGFRPDVIGITSTSPAHHAAVEMAHFITKLDPGIIICKGGTHETYGGRRSQGMDDYPIDISFIGEADISFPAVLEAMERHGGQDQLGRIPGICFRDDKDTRIATSEKPTLVAPEQFVIPAPGTVEPEPAFDILDPVSGGGTGMIRLQSMRGCGFGCTYCAISGKGRRVDPVQWADYVVQAVRGNDITTNGTPSVFFEDATFTIEEHASFSKMDRWTRQFCRRLQELGTLFRFGIQTRADCLNPEICRILHEAGCRSVYMGVETLSASVLRSLKKGTDSNTQLAAIAAAQQTGLNVTASIICDVGTEQDFRFTLSALDRAGVQEIFVEAEKIFPGTGLSRNREEEVLAFYDAPPRGSSPNHEDHYCMLVHDEEMIARRYRIADELLMGRYAQKGPGHYWRKDGKPIGSR